LLVTCNDTVLLSRPRQYQTNSLGIGNADEAELDAAVDPVLSLGRDWSQLKKNLCRLQK
jgi:hypothetical protein